MDVGGEADIWPLTEDWPGIDQLRENLVLKGVSVRVLEAGRLIDECVSLLRGKLLVWGLRLSELEVNGRTLRETLEVGWPGMSGWWLSSFTERNPLKTDVFFRLAQLNAIEVQLARSHYEQMVLFVPRGDLHDALARMAARHGVRVLPVEGVLRSNRLREVLVRCGSFAEAIFRLAQWLWAGFPFWLSARFGSVPREEDGRVLFLCYFPLLDRPAAMDGRFVNRFARPLQELLEQMRVPVEWLMMVVPFEGVGRWEAAVLSKRLRKAGTRIRFLYEFLSVSLLYRICRDFIQLFIRAAKALRQMRPGTLSNGVCVPEGEVFLRRLWERSFSGWVCLEGLLYLRLFEKIFQSSSGLNGCLYFAEMQVWEKALNAARHENAPSVRTIGFQHAAVSRNHFFYRMDPKNETTLRQSASHLLPDVLAVNGRRFKNSAEIQGLVDVRSVEAVRQLHIKKVINQRLGSKTHPPVVLLVGSIDVKETAAILSLVHAAFQEGRPFGFWIRPHPSTSREALLGRAGKASFDFSDAFRSEPLETLLSNASVVIGGETSVVIEALAHGCRVVAPVLNESLFLSPLDGQEHLYKKVYGPRELREAVLSGLATPMNGDEWNAARLFIEDSWDLDETLPGWRALLEEMRNAG